MHLPKACPQTFPDTFLRLALEHFSKRIPISALGVLRHTQKVFDEEISEEFPEAFFAFFLGGLLINCFLFQDFKDFILHFIDIYFALNSFSNFSRYYLLPAKMIGILLIKIIYLRLQSWSK